MKQIAEAVRIMDVGQRSNQTVDRSRLGINTYLSLHAEVPLAALSGRRSSPGSGPAFVFGRRECGGNGGIHDGSFGQPQFLGLKVQVNGF
jgi:hypothetical protein